MTRLTILLLTITQLAVGQKAGLECIDQPSQFQLFNPQIKHHWKPKSVSNIKDIIADSIYLKIDFSKGVRYDYLIKGIQLYFINTKVDEITFDIDFLQLICQAKVNDTWVDIDARTPDRIDWGSIRTLPRDTYFEAIMPCYTGTAAAQLRFRLTIDNRTFYSEEFTGQINPKIIRTK